MSIVYTSSKTDRWCHNYKRFKEESINLTSVMHQYGGGRTSNRCVRAVPLKWNITLDNQCFINSLFVFPGASEGINKPLLNKQISLVVRRPAEGTLQGHASGEAWPPEDGWMTENLHRQQDLWSCNATETTETETTATLNKSGVCIDDGWQQIDRRWLHGNAAAACHWRWQGRKWPCRRCEFSYLQKQQTFPRVLSWQESRGSEQQQLFSI